MNIVIVDNDQPLLRSLEILLRNEGHRVAVFHKALQAVDFLRNRSVDVLILDYVMPELNGIELLERVKKHPRRQGKVIMYSGHIDQIDRSKLDQLGVSDLLAKPFDLEKLCNLINQQTEVV